MILFKSSFSHSFPPCGVENLAELANPPFFGIMGLVQISTEKLSKGNETIMYCGAINFEHEEFESFEK